MAYLHSQIRNLILIPIPISFLHYSSIKVYMAKLVAYSQWAGPGKWVPVFVLVSTSVNVSTWFYSFHFFLYQSRSMWMSHNSADLTEAYTFIQPSFGFMRKLWTSSKLCTILWKFAQITGDTQFTDGLLFFYNKRPGWSSLKLEKRGWCSLKRTCF